MKFEQLPEKAPLLLAAGVLAVVAAVGLAITATTLPAAWSAKRAAEQLQAAPSSSVSAISTPLSKPDYDALAARLWAYPAIKADATHQGLRLQATDLAQFLAFRAALSHVLASAPEVRFEVSMCIGTPSAAFATAPGAGAMGQAICQGAAQAVITGTRPQYTLVQTDATAPAQ